MYHLYVESGLKDVTVDGMSIAAVGSRTTVTVPDVRGLHAEIARALLLRAGPLDSRALRFLRLEAGLTQKQIGQLVLREGLAVSRWERGQTIEPLVDVGIRLALAERLGIEVPSFERLTALVTAPRQAGGLHFTRTEGGRWVFCDATAAAAAA